MNCVGKRLALVNIRVTVAMIVMRYNISFPPTQADPEANFEKGLYEHFALQSGPLFLCFEKRNQ
jgi:tryprostatin B 6-hydroxylase